MDNASLGNIFESLMLVAFGFAWPANILHTLRRKSAIGKSLSFLIIVIIGYIFGASAKLVQGNINYVLLFYIINLSMVSFDLSLYFYYSGKEKKLKGILGTTPGSSAPESSDTPASHDTPNPDSLGGTPGSPGGSSEA
jgi:hypothetical protein